MLCRRQIKFPVPRAAPGAQRTASTHVAAVWLKAVAGQVIGPCTDHPRRGSSSGSKAWWRAVSVDRTATYTLYWRQNAEPYRLARIQLASSDRRKFYVLVKLCILYSAICLCVNSGMTDCRLRVLSSHCLSTPLIGSCCIIIIQHSNYGIPSDPLLILRTPKFWRNCGPHTMRTRQLSITVEIIGLQRRVDDLHDHFRFY